MVHTSGGRAESNLKQEEDPQTNIPGPLTSSGVSSPFGSPREKGEA